MIPFFFKVFLSIIIIFSTYTLFRKKEIKILEIIVLLFIFHLCMYSFLLNINIFIIIISSILIISIYYLYLFLEDKELNKKISKQSVLINRGIINFKELINLNYSYDELLYDLKKKGIDNIDNIDYCIKLNNELIIFQKNSIRNYPISLIIDGNIIKDNLFSVKKTIEWLNKKIEDNNLILANINYAYYKNKEIYFITN